MTNSLTQNLLHHSVGRTVYKAKYSPKGVFDSMSDYLASGASGEDQGLLIREAYQAPQIYRSVFGPQLSPYLDGDMKEEGHEIWLASIMGGRIDTDKGSSIAVFNRNEELLGDVSFQFVKRPEGGYDHGQVRQNNIFQRTYLTKPHQVRGTVFSLLTGGGGNANFYHWFVDVLSRFVVLQESDWQDEIDYFLVPNHALKFQKETLQLLGIPEEKIIDGMKHPHLKADRLIVVSHPRTTTYHIPAFLCEYLQQTFAELEIPSDESLGSHPFIYINRGDAPKRKVTNEKEVEAVLAEFGFTSFALSGLTLKQAIQLFRQAKMVVVPHGAGLTNLIFCPTGTDVLALFSDKFVNHYLYELAHGLTLKYDFLVGDPLNDHIIKSRYEGIEEDMKIDLHLLRKKVSEALG
tara:strand:+ start:1 stop:1215 length:1215 start_codon:yes stop_codon:yes gene_type:complete